MYVTPITGTNSINTMKGIVKDLLHEKAYSNNGRSETPEDVVRKANLARLKIRDLSRKVSILNDAAIAGESKLSSFEASSNTPLFTREKSRGFF